MSGAFLGAGALGFFFPRRIWLAIVVPTFLVWFATFGWQLLKEPWGKVSSEGVAMYVGWSSIIIIGYGILCVVGALAGRSLAPASRQPIPPSVSPPDAGALGRLMKVFNATFVVMVVGAILTPVIATQPWASGLAVGLLVAPIAGLVFLVCLGMIVHRLGKSAILWVLLTLFTSPIGALVAYFMVRKAVGDVTDRVHLDQTPP